MPTGGGNSTAQQRWSCTSQALDGTEANTPLSSKWGQSTIQAHMLQPGPPTGLCWGRQLPGSSMVHCCHSAAGGPDLMHTCSAHHFITTEPPTQGSCCFRPAAGIHICCAQPLPGSAGQPGAVAVTSPAADGSTGAHSPGMIKIGTADWVHHCMPPFVCTKRSPSGRWRRYPPA